MKMDASLIALDFQKAFDSINQDFLQKVLTRIGLPTHFTEIVKAINTSTRSQIFINGYLTKPVTMERGVRQGDPLSISVWEGILLGGRKKFALKITTCPENNFFNPNGA